MRLLRFRSYFTTKRVSFEILSFELDEDCDKSWFQIVCFMGFAREDDVEVEN